jgi:hypothetical protein
MKSAAQIQGNQLKSVKTLSQRGLNMYRQIETKVVTAENPELKFEGKLAKDNRWVIMSELIPCLDSLNRRGTRRARIAGKNLKKNMQKTFPRQEWEHQPSHLE